MLTVFLDPTSTSQLSSLYTAQSSWRYTTTLGAHPHCMQNSREPDTCHNVWRMSNLWSW